MAPTEEEESQRSSGGATNGVEGVKLREDQRWSEIRNNNNNNNKEMKKKKKKKRMKSLSYLVRGLSCFGSDDRHPSVVEASGRGDKGIDMVAGSAGQRRVPDHLVIMINGLIGSAQNWRYAAKQFLKKYSQDVIVHCSKCNPSRLTFDGVDVMGDRVAKEVVSVIKRYPDVQKISFMGHSLGGLVARYAIARLYTQDLTTGQLQGNGDCKSDKADDSCHEERLGGKIAGLEPMNFITCATPHLGSRGHKQVPAFCGFYSLEKAASHASWFLGRTGKHLFLTDNDDGKPPLLLQMVKDCEHLKFISALQSFKRRVAYANIRFDSLVGWSTSSLRRRSELPKRRELSRHPKYPHIFNVEGAKSVSLLQQLSAEANVNGQKTIDMEEEMISSLTKLSWERVDVYFKGSTQRLFAHTTIQVQNYWLHSDGADVISHMIDNFLL